MVVFEEIKYSIKRIKELSVYDWVTMVASPKQNDYLSISCPSFKCSISCIKEYYKLSIIWTTTIAIQLKMLFLKKATGSGTHPPVRTGRQSEQDCPRIQQNHNYNNNNGAEGGTIRLMINDKCLEFVDGLWMQHETDDISVGGLGQLKARMDQLEQENQLLHIKQEILIDALAESECKKLQL